MHTDFVPKSMEREKEVIVPYLLSSCSSYKYVSARRTWLTLVRDSVDIMYNVIKNGSLPCGFPV